MHANKKDNIAAAENRTLGPNLCVCVLLAIHLFQVIRQFSPRVEVTMLRELIAKHNPGSVKSSVTNLIKTQRDLESYVLIVTKVEKVF